MVYSEYPKFTRWGKGADFFSFGPQVAKERGFCKSTR
jgi:hypothetical protein